MKYLKKPHLKRKRIQVPKPGTIEMHRNARVDYYTPDFIELIIKNLNLKELNRYPDVENFSTHLAKYHELNLNNFLLSSGIDGAIKVIFEMCTRQNDKVLCLGPTYGMYYVYADAYNVELKEIISHENSFKIDINDILRHFSNEFGVLFLPNPHMPLENVFTLDELKIIITKAKEYDILVFIDEAYYMFGSESAISLINEYNNLVVARTFSKGMGLPAIRLGYLVANEFLINYLSSRRFAHESNSISLDIAKCAIDNIEKFESYNKNICKMRDFLITEINKLGFKTHGGKSNTVLVCFDTYEIAIQFTKYLGQKNVLVRGDLPKPAQKCVLVTVGSKTFAELFLELLYEFKNIIYLNE